MNAPGLYEERVDMFSAAVLDTNAYEQDEISDFTDPIEIMISRQAGRENHAPMVRISDARTARFVHNFSYPPKS